MQMCKEVPDLTRFLSCCDYAKQNDLKSHILSLLCQTRFSTDFMTCKVYHDFQNISNTATCENVWNKIRPHCYISSSDLYAAFWLACRSWHCRFDGDVCTTVQAPLAAEGRPSSEQHQANQSITSLLCPQRQTADSWLLFNLRAMPLSEMAWVAWPLRAATLKQPTVIRWWNSNAWAAS